MNMKAVERYRHAVAMKSQAEEYRQTAVQYCDAYRAIERLEYWKKEVEKTYSYLTSTD